MKIILLTFELYSKIDHVYIEDSVYFTQSYHIDWYPAFGSV